MLLRRFNVIEKLLKEREVADLPNFPFSLAWLRRCRLVGGGIPFLKIGYSVRYRASDVELWLDSLVPDPFKAEKDLIAKVNLDLPEPFQSEKDLIAKVNLDLPEPFQAEKDLIAKVNLDLPDPFRAEKDLIAKFDLTGGELAQKGPTS